MMKSEIPVKGVPLTVPSDITGLWKCGVFVRRFDPSLNLEP